MKGLISEEARELLNNQESAQELLDFVLSGYSTGRTETNIQVNGVTYSVSSSTASTTISPTPSESSGN